MVFLLGENACSIRGAGFGLVLHLRMRTCPKQRISRIPMPRDLDVWFRYHRVAVLSWLFVLNTHRD